MMGSHTALMVYSVFSSLVIIVLSILYSYCGSAICESEKIETMNGNVNKITKSETDVSLISFKKSKDYLSPEQQECECGGIVGLERTILEILVLGLIGIGCLAGIMKGFCHFKGLIQEKLEKAKIARNLKIRSQVEAELTEKSAGPGKSADSPLEDQPNQLCRAERRETGPEMVLTFP